MSDELEKLRHINKSKMKCLIVAAGLGSRLKGHTEHNPKCMLDFGGKTLLQRQLFLIKIMELKIFHLYEDIKKIKLIIKV